MDAQDGKRAPASANDGAGGAERRPKRTLLVLGCVIPMLLALGLLGIAEREEARKADDARLATLGQACRECINSRCDRYLTNFGASAEERQRQEEAHRTQVRARCPMCAESQTLRAKLASPLYPFAGLD